MENEEFSDPEFKEKMEEVYENVVLNDGILREYSTGLCSNAFLIERLEFLRSQAIPLVYDELRAEMIDRKEDQEQDIYGDGGI